MSGGNPRILEELLIELGARKYKIDGSFGLDLLDLDRRIHEIGLSIEATAESRKMKDGTSAARFQRASSAACPHDVSVHRQVAFGS